MTKLISVVRIHNSYAAVCGNVVEFYATERAAFKALCVLVARNTRLSDLIAVPEDIREDFEEYCDQNAKDRPDWDFVRHLQLCGVMEDNEVTTMTAAEAAEVAALVRTAYENVQ